MRSPGIRISGQFAQSQSLPLPKLINYFQNWKLLRENKAKVWEKMGSKRQSRRKRFGFPHFRDLPGTLTTHPKKEMGEND